MSESVLDYLLSFKAIMFIVLVLLKRYFAGGACKIQRNLKDKVIIITGCNTGIGYETAVQLAYQGATLILANKSAYRTLPLTKLLLSFYGPERV